MPLHTDVREVFLPLARLRCTESVWADWRKDPGSSGFNLCIGECAINLTDIRVLNTMG